MQHCMDTVWIQYGPYGLDTVWILYGLYQCLFKTNGQENIPSGSKNLANVSSNDVFAAMTVTWSGPKSNIATNKNNKCIKLSIISKR